MDLDITLFALFLLSMVLIGLHMPYAVLALTGILVFAVTVTRLSWSILSSFESVEAD